MKKPEAKSPETKASSPVAKNENVHRDLSHIIRRPRITEKSSIHSERGVYVFEVATSATKGSIRQAIKELYNVTPVRVATSVIPDKKIQSRGKWGTKSGGKKAYVYLKKGETIEFV